MTTPNASTRIGVGLRLGAMLLDHFFMCVIALLFFIPGFISTFSAAFNPSHDDNIPGLMGGPPGYVAGFAFTLYFCKDIFNGRSIAKRILGLQVVNNSTGKVGSPMRCFIRDITCVLWPIEGIIAIVDTSRRLGDRIAGTKLVKFDPSLEQPKISIVSVLIPLCISYGMVLVLMQGFPNSNGSSVNYSKTSYNRSESAALEKLLTDSLGQDLVPDIRIYDTIKNGDLKYISLILKLKENYLDDDGNYRKLKAHTLALIYTQFPGSTFIGQMEYIYRSPGQIETRSSTIGGYLKPREVRQQ